MVHLVNMMNEKKLNVKFMVEDVVGCKWSMTVLDMVDQGVSRPGAMVREQEGLTTKVLNERLKKLVDYKIFKKIEYPEVPPRVEYEYTEFGRKFLDIVTAIRKLETDLSKKV